MYCNTIKQGSMMGMAMMGMVMGSCATRQMMDKSSKMRKFGMKKIRRFRNVLDLK